MTTLKLRSALAAPILLGSVVAPLALHQAPAKAVEVCIDGQPVSFELSTEIIDENWKFAGGIPNYPFTDNARDRMTQVRAGSLPWLDNRNTSLELSTQYTAAFFIFTAQT